MNLNYREFLKQQSIDQKTISNPDIGRFMLDNHVRTMFGYFPFAYYVVNYNSLQFESIQNTGTLGYTKDDFLKEGLPGSLKNIHPDDFKLVSAKVFPKVLEFLSFESKDPNNYRFSINFRYKRKDKSYMYLQQHMTFIDFNRYNLPLRNLSIISDISSCKKDTSLNLTITKLTGEKEKVLLQKKYLHESPSVFSEREKTILDLAVQGLTSKEIADKLFISINTVKNHRRNMMDKSNTSNIVSLMDFYIKTEQPIY